MTTDQANQCARIIKRVFEFEESVDPRTIAEMFIIIANLLYFKNDGCIDEVGDE